MTVATMLAGLLLALACAATTHVAAQLGEAPELDTTSVPASVASTRTSSSTLPLVSSTESVDASACGSSQIGVYFDTAALIQQAANATTEEHCCQECQRFQYCAAWAFNQETDACHLFSRAIQGSIPEGTDMMDWISSTQTTPLEKTYDCNVEGSNCYSCVASMGTCTRCDNFKYLLAGECVDDCTPYGYINFGDRGRNRVCVPPTTCTAPDCECPSSLFGNFCNECNVGYGDASECTDCRSDRYVVDGRCRLEITCKGYSFVELPSVSCNCRTPELQNNCFRCTHQGGFGVTEPTIACRQCRNSLYYDPVAQTCLQQEECPQGTVPTNNGAYDRVCLPPSDCMRNKHLETGRRCRCQDSANCFICRYDELGHRCLRCKNGKYLLGGECADECPSDHTHANTGGTYGRECRDTAFACVSGLSSVDGSECNCPEKNCASCTYAIGNASREAPCTACRSGYTLHEASGQCRKGGN